MERADTTCRKISRTLSTIIFSQVETLEFIRIKKNYLLSSQKVGEKNSKKFSEDFRHPELFNKV